MSRGGRARRTLPRRSGGRPKLPARRQAPRARAMAAAIPLDTMAGAMTSATEDMAECLRPSCPCHTCVVYGLSPGRRPEPHPRPGHVLQVWMAHAMREDGKTRRPSLALGCIDMRSCTDRRHAHTGLTTRLRSASDERQQTRRQQTRRQQIGTAPNPTRPTHSPAPHGSSFHPCVGLTTLTSPRSVHV